MPPAFNLSFSVSLPVKLVNWSNGSQGISRVAMLRKSRIRKSQRGIAKIAVGAKVRAMVIAPDMWLPIVVTMTRVSPRAFDDDGLRSALKSIRDGIADVFGIADNTPYIEWRYEQRRGAVREYGVEIFVQRAPNGLQAIWDNKARERFKSYRVRWSKPDESMGGEIE